MPGPYDIAPATTGSEIGLAQMRYGLSASLDYNASNIFSDSPTDIETLVVNSTTYQSSLVTKNWDTSQPYGFGEMAGKVWNDSGTQYTLYWYTTNNYSPSANITSFQAFGDFPNLGDNRLFQTLNFTNGSAGFNTTAITFFASFEFKANVAFSGGVQIKMGTFAGGSNIGITQIASPIDGVTYSLTSNYYLAVSQNFYITIDNYTP